MADKVTTSKKSSEDTSDKVVRLAEELKQAMMENGTDEGTADALLHAVQPNSEHIVGNLADLQRLGGLIAKGEGGVEEAVVTYNVDEEDPTAPAQKETGKKEG